MRSRLQFLSVTLMLLSLICSPQVAAAIELSDIAQTSTIQNRKSKAERLTQEAVQLIEKQQFASGIEKLQQAIAIYNAIGDRNKEFETLLAITTVYYGQNDAANTIKFSQQALTVAREVKNPEFEAATLTFLISIYTNLGDYQKVIEFGEIGLAIARDLKNVPLEAIFLVALGDAHDSQGSFQTAIELAQASLKIAREIKNSEVEAQALVTIASAYDSLEKPEKVIEFGTQGLKLATQLKNQQLQSLALVNLVSAYGALEEYQKAGEALEQGAQIAVELKNYPLVSSFMIEASKIASANYKYQEAINFAEQALSFAKQAKIPQAELSPLGTLIGIYFELGDYPKIKELSQQGREIAKKINNRSIEALMVFSLATANFAQGNYKEALSQSTTSLAIAKEAKNPLIEAVALLGLGFINGDLGNYQPAMQSAQASLSIARQQKYSFLESSTLEVIGGLQFKYGQKEQAIASYREALAIDDSSFTTKAGLARAYRDLNKPTTAITYYKQAINDIEEVRGGVRNLSGKLEESFLQAIQGLDRTKTSDIYRELADVLLSQGRILEAQQVLELLKIQEVRDFTGNTRAGGTETAYTPIEEQIIKENGTLIAFGQKLEECQLSSCPLLDKLLDQQDTLTRQFNAKIERIEQQVRANRAKDEAFFDPNKLAFKAREIVDAQPGTIVIYPLVLADKVWLLWVAKGGVFKTVEVNNVNQQQLGETVVKFRQLLQNPNSNQVEVKATGKQLYDWLIKPLEPELKANEIQNLVFSLDRSTRYIPMSALFDGKQYLIENYAVSTVLSAELTNTSDRLPPGTANTSVLALGLSNAVAGFNPLPNVPAELDAIVKTQQNDTQGIYPGVEFLNQEFNFKALRNNLRSHQILHIATHGQFVPGLANKSYLLLGTGEKLPISDIQTLQNLGNVHLVVLSACETALAGPAQDGTEIAGLSYYFLNQGAKAVMASLWQVDDQSTRSLMQSFYSQLAQNTTTPITKSQALRQAQLNLMQGKATGNNNQRASLVVEPRQRDKPAITSSNNSEFSHPYYWAPFILIGNAL